ncbi:unnamed protein product [Darwinula stevensoni]|uniref:Uncharacterized protein n=1 Tax=Darwinula stevensoni TaxID=69355 RepID=A0A7R9A204_9CRUS|nr:unnamed protein product [Darwinula stevensoni]CAG0887711.1 unnamed protein product [Darwinula stevensoni]
MTVKTQGEGRKEGEGERSSPNGPKPSTYNGQPQSRPRQQRRERPSQPYSRGKQGRAEKSSGNPFPQDLSWRHGSQPITYSSGDSALLSQEPQRSYGGPQTSFMSDPWANLQTHPMMYAYEVNFGPHDQSQQQFQQPVQQRQQYESQPQQQHGGHQRESKSQSGYQPQPQRLDHPGQPMVEMNRAYSFSYEAPDHDREEKSDSDGNVNGRYSFVAPDGVRREVKYQAGAGKGFLAQGDHIPQMLASMGIQPLNPFMMFQPEQGQGAWPPHPQQWPKTQQFYPQPRPTVQQPYSKSWPTVQQPYPQQQSISQQPYPQPLPTVQQSRPQKLSAVHKPYPQERPGAKPQASYPQEPNRYFQLNRDMSYRFGYDTGEGHRRQEERSGDGKVTGSFSYPLPDGSQRKYDYVATEDGGFMIVNAEGDPYFPLMMLAGD